MQDNTGFSGMQAVEAKALLELRETNPHAILGPHPFDHGVIVRALRPDADEIVLLPDDGSPQPMERLLRDGLFETLVRDRTRLGYRLELHYGGGGVTTIHDPYAFAPTLGELDLYLINSGRDERTYQKLGAHPGEHEGLHGVAFAVWAPNAAGVSVVGDFNHWDGRIHQMRALGGSGIWELFIPELAPGACYKYELRMRGGGPPMLKTDPYAAAMEEPPRTGSVVYQPAYRFTDQEWLERRANLNPYRSPMSIYEVHLGSWRRDPDHLQRQLSYRELAPMLADYVNDMGFTHVELLPVMEHPFAPSWGYQVSGYFAPTARWGSPDDFRFLVDHLHNRGIGIILDWVPAHFPKDDFSLGRFDGTALYEHLDPRQGEHPDWGTYIFNYGRSEVRAFLIASALNWLGEYHADGLRVDAVASMLYLDYARRAGDWIPNRYGGRENLDAVEFIRQLNETVYRLNPGATMVAEESTAWGAVSRPTYVGGLGFGFKWDMGWMHDTLRYFTLDPIHRRFHHQDLTFGFLYAWSENFILPLSHDEVVHGKSAMLSKMPGDRWQQFANLRSLYGYMWAHPGKKLLFMGSEFGQWREWYHGESLDWHLCQYEEHRGLQLLVRDLNRLYREEPALWEGDPEPAGFQWVDLHNADENVIAFLRIAPQSGRRLLCVCNFAPVVRRNYRVGAPAEGVYHEILNTDSTFYAGSDVGNGGALAAEPIPWHGLPHSLNLTLPPLATMWFTVP
ncbi:MAG TPA: 1,4-alpha-glucan branching protein GlgB [Candidatus Binataceae bacterium]|nr:1,4-alpha-glucan branching protein GlgB [Candidatus Binataceae bacterium]